MATPLSEPIEPAPDKEIGVAGKPAPPPQPDPVVRALQMTILLVVIVVLMTIVYALVTNLFGGSAPRTMAQFKLASAESKIEAGSKERKDWVEYISALIETGQYRLAQEWIDKGKRTLKSQDVSADMVYMQATLYNAQNELDKALKTADQGLATIKKTHEEALKEWEKTRAPTEASIGLHDNYWELLLLKAEVYEKKKDWKAAVAAYTEYLGNQPTAATILVRRGSAKEKVGDVAGAEADFRAALKYIPDEADALAGLKRIGVKK